MTLTWPVGMGDILAQMSWPERLLFLVVLAVVCAGGSCNP
jgi:hypothetical protein